MDIVMGIVVWPGLGSLTLIGFSVIWQTKHEPNVILLPPFFTILFMGAGIASRYTSPPAPAYVISAFFTFTALWLAFTWLVIKRAKKAAGVES